jgi:mannose-6-phosphate isomerase-like protein (cupin superfamily)
MTLSIAHAPDISPERTAAGAVTRTLLDTRGAGGHLVRRMVDIPPGLSYAGTAGPGGELWFVISGSGRLELDEAGTPRAVAVGRRHGLRVPAGASYRLHASEAEAIALDAVTLPEASAEPEPGSLVSDLADCEVEMTGDRRFRVVFGPGRGCAEATQFVGEIPPGRAPDHSHTYDEVVLILEGTGVVHAGDTDHPIAPGSCVHLAPGQRHCLENTGEATLVVLGVFHPGGSPAAKKVADRRD